MEPSIKNVDTWCAYGRIHGSVGVFKTVKGQTRMPKLLEGIFECDCVCLYVCEDCFVVDSCERTLADCDE